MRVSQGVIDFTACADKFLCQDQCSDTSALACQCLAATSHKKSSYLCCTGLVRKLGLWKGIWPEPDAGVCMCA